MLEDDFIRTFLDWDAELLKIYRDNVERGLPMMALGCRRQVSGRVYNAEGDGVVRCIGYSRIGLSI